MSECESHALMTIAKLRASRSSLTSVTHRLRAPPHSAMQRVHDIPPPVNAAPLPTPHRLPAKCTFFSSFVRRWGGSDIGQDPMHLHDDSFVANCRAMITEACTERLVCLTSARDLGSYPAQDSASSVLHGAGHEYDT